ncbi:MAG: NapC/NirT family cytochrome c, partial [Elusimicrobia bacterium]|nr:NapC/NirT family cytochrome c [Elusimicrobiota bacterium]
MSFKIGRWTLGLPAMLAVVVLILAAGWGTVEYSESPTFCNSCHIMGPYFQAWKASKHNKVRCVECHYPPASPKTLIWKKFQALSQVAKYVTRTYSSKPFAEVDNASCLRSGCHSQRLLEGKVVAKNGVLFDHRPHLTEVRRGRQLRCVSCHSQVMVGEHIAVTYTTCFLCHFKGRGEGRDLKPIAGCTGCHSLPKQDFKIAGMTYNHKEFVGRGVACQSCHRDIVQGEGAAPKDRCLACHNQPNLLTKIDDHVLLHEKHVTEKNIACIHCHEPMKHGFATDGKELPPIKAVSKPGAPSEKVVEVPASHPPTLNFDCSLCHTDKHAGQLELYSGRAKALGLPEIPSPMFLARVDCVGCHYQKTEGGRNAEGVAQATFKASTEACVKCHGPRFKGMWESI